MLCSVLHYAPFERATRHSNVTPVNFILVYQSAAGIKVSQRSETLAGSRAQRSMRYGTSGKGATGAKGGDGKGGTGPTPTTAQR